MITYAATPPMSSLRPSAHRSLHLLRKATLPRSSTVASHRSLFGFGSKRKAAAKDSAFTPPPPPLLAQDDLFHPLSKSPFVEMREKSKRIQQLAYCPVSVEQGAKAHVAFECPDCGFPTHATEEKWKADAEKARYWPRLREANEDEHDLRSGREMTEFKLPGSFLPLLRLVSSSDSRCDPELHSGATV